MILRPRPLTLLLLLLILGYSCTSSLDSEKSKQELLQVDRDFSKLSKEKGMNKAFIEYLANDGVLLRPNRMPMTGREKITEWFSKPDTSFSLTWEPLFADVSESGEMGYTYGIYRVEMDSPEGEPVTTEGTYLSVWKRDKEGHWKFVADTGNQGLGKKVQ